MNTARVYIIIFFSAFLYSSNLVAQDPIFSQFYSAPLQINPAFAGNTYTPRVGLNYRNEWSGWGGVAYETYAASYDQFFEQVNIGLGLMAQTDQAGGGLFRISKFSGFFSYRAKVNDNFYLKLGVEAGAWQTRIGVDKLIFGDELSRTEGYTGDLPTEEILNLDNKTIFDVSAGLLAYGPMFYGGFSIKHINTPDDRHIETTENFNSGLPYRFSLHGGAQISLKEGNKKKLGSFISPNLLFEKQSDLSQINLGVYAGLGPIFAGGWFRHTFANADAVIGLIGFRQKAYKIGYSYDFTVSNPLNTTNNQGTHEISFVLNFDHNRSKINYNDCFELFR